MIGKEMSSLLMAGPRVGRPFRERGRRLENPVSVGATFLPSAENGPAVDVQDFAGDVARQVGGQE
jgi:hypothetical protein